MWLALWGLMSPARGGEGPWALEPHVYNLYLGADYFRYSQMNDGLGQTAIDIGTGLSAFAVNGVWTVGLRPGIEGELKLTYEAVRVNQPDVALCTEDKPTDWCEPTAGVGDLTGTLKARVLNEFSGAPLTLSVLGLVRSGEAYANRRRRLTTLGDGQTDLGLALSVGRKANLGIQNLRFQVTGGYYYRFPNQRLADRKVPTDEVFGQADLAWGPVPSFEIGPTAVGFSRIGGINIPELDFFDHDAWNQTAAAQIKVGGRIALFSIQRRTLSASVLYTVFARNNPANTLSITIGGGQLRAVKPEVQ